MKRLTEDIKRKVLRIRREKHHPLIHKIHKTHRISHKTLFYMKEYGKKSHIASVIIKESFVALVISFILSIFGGVAMQSIKPNFIMFTPLLILLPPMNDMIGDYSMIMVSRLSTIVFMRGLAKKWWLSEDVRKMIRTIIFVAILSATYIGLISSFVAYLKGFSLTLNSTIKVLEISLLTTLVMIAVVIFVSGFGVLYVYKKREDPNNIVMPIITSIADLGTVLAFALFIKLVF